MRTDRHVHASCRNHNRVAWQAYASPCPSCLPARPRSGPLCIRWDQPALCVLNGAWAVPRLHSVTCVDLRETSGSSMGTGMAVTRTYLSIGQHRQIAQHPGPFHGHTYVSVSFHTVTGLSVSAHLGMARSLYALYSSRIAAGLLPFRHHSGGHGLIGVHGIGCL